MEKEWACECGVTLDGDSDPEWTGKVQERARKDHHNATSQEEARKEVKTRHS